MKLLKESSFVEGFFNAQNHENRLRPLSSFCRPVDMKYSLPEDR